MVSFPNAKINLGLNIVRKRDDGYHDISTLFYPIDWKDVLEIVPAKGPATTLKVTGRTINGKSHENLVMKAYRKLGEKVDIPPCDIFLHKVIPDGAGLGGGSADAAFTLMMLNDMFAFGLGKRELARVAAEIGADCPFFIYNRPMLASGTGTDLMEIQVDLSGKNIVVVKPSFSISTSEAYAGCTPGEWSEPLHEVILRPIGEWKSLLRNDFERNLNTKYSDIELIKGVLRGCGALVTMLSGSGSAVYGIFDKPIDAGDILRYFPGCTVHISAV